SMIHALLPARLARSTSRMSRLRRKAPGRSRLPANTELTARISPNMRGLQKPRKDLPPTSTAMSMPSAQREAAASFASPHAGEGKGWGAQDYRQEELLADVIARLIGDAQHAAIGAASPIPAAGALLARERGHGRPRVSLLGSRRQNFFSD